MHVEEDKQFSKDYLDPEKRSIANSMQIFFKDGSKTEKVTIEYPLGHRNRREEGIPLLFKKFTDNVSTRFDDAKIESMLELFHNHEDLEVLPVNELMDMLVV